MRAPLTLLLFTLSATIGSPGCGGPAVDLAQGLEVLDVSTGWQDEGIVGGDNKLVPRIDFKLKNVSDQPLVALQIMAVFRRVSESQELGSNFVPVTRSNALDPAATSEVQTIKSNFGYKGQEARADMLKNSQFIDAKVDMMAKYSSVQWKKIAEYPIERRLLTK